MADNRPLIRLTGWAAIAAGVCYVPLVLVDGWQSVAAIATPSWWLVAGLATAHHPFVLFALMGIFAVAVRRPGASGVAAFVVASIGNLLMTGIGAVRLTVLPALAAHPTAASGLDCTPFFTPATAAAAGLTARACEPWQFGALELWFGVAWLTLFAGSIWIAIEVLRRAVLAKAAAGLLAGGWLILAAGFALPLPALPGRIAHLALVAAWIWLGSGLLRRARA